MNMQCKQTETLEYRCPGEKYAVSRAVHLGRLARFYSACRQCSHRGDTGTLSPRQVARLEETEPRGRPAPLFCEEGAEGVYLNDLGPKAVREMAAALGVTLQRRSNGEWKMGTGSEPPQMPNPQENDAGSVPVPFFHGAVAPPAVGGTVAPPEKGVRHRRQHESPLPHRSATEPVPIFGLPHPAPRIRNNPPVVVLAGDGRPIAAELVAAAAEGLRYGGCHLVDVGPATSACLAFAVDHLGADGGVLVGGPGDRANVVALKFWDAAPAPLSAGAAMQPVEQIYHTGVDRPTRTAGSMRRFQAEGPYLAALAEHYHALRPLRVILHTSCGPLSRYLDELTGPLACRIGRSRTTVDGLPGQIADETAHFGVQIDDDGERCRVWDEQGRPVPNERLLLLVARALLSERPGGAIVLEEGTPAAVVQGIESAGGRVSFSGRLRRATAMAMRSQAGLFGGGTAGRFWYDRDGLPLPDALMTLTLLLVLSSRSDRRFSEVLDREAVLG